jgi:hypothetical protein
MVIPLILMVFLAFLTLLFGGGILYFKKRRRIGILLMAAPFVIVAGAVGMFYWMFNQSTPDSLDLKVTYHDCNYVLEGKWKERPDTYSYGTDLLVFYVKDNHEIQVGDYQGSYAEIHEGILQAAMGVLQESPNYPEGLEPQIFEIKLQRKFTVEFSIPKDLTLEDIVIQYVHIAIPPMDQEFYWIKTYKGKDEDLPYFTR